MNHKIISKITSSALLFTIVTYITTPVFAFTKEETVYSKLNSEGNNYNTIVNSHIENKNQEQTINDISDLLNIKNVDGDQEFKQEGNSLLRNAEVTDIKAIDDGTKTTLIGMSIPGMQESLNISKDKLEIPNKIEITMESTDFELNNIVTYVTPKLIEDDDIELFDDIDKIYSKVDTLQSSANQIQEGANTLAQGKDKLYS